MFSGLQNSQTQFSPQTSNRMNYLSENAALQFAVTVARCRIEIIIFNLFRPWMRCSCNILKCCVRRNEKLFEFSKNWRAAFLSTVGEIFIESRKWRYIGGARKRAAHEDNPMTWEPFSWVRCRLNRWRLKKLEFIFHFLFPRSLKSTWPEAVFDVLFIWFVVKFYFDILIFWLSDCRCQTFQYFAFRYFIFRHLISLFYWWRCLAVSNFRFF